MKPSSISEIQKELITLDTKQVVELCMKLAKYKKENKELLSYLLFNVNDESTYINNVKKQIDDLFSGINRTSTYTTKKGLQKVVRNMNKFIKHSDSKQTEIETRIYFCKKVRAGRIDLDSSAIICNMYYRERDKINAALSKLHEDMQYDYQEDISRL